MFIFNDETEKLLIRQNGCILYGFVQCVDSYETEQNRVIYKKHVGQYIENVGKI